MDILGPEDFDQSGLRRPGMWVVDFSADWCPFCQEFLPKFASLDGDGDFRLAIGDLTDVESSLWDRFDLRVTPTLIVFCDGVPVFRRDGRPGEGLDEGDLRTLLAALPARRDGHGPTPGTRA